MKNSLPEKKLWISLYEAVIHALFLLHLIYLLCVFASRLCDNEVAKTFFLIDAGLP